MSLLHITAHLGGGVGKVLASLVAESQRRQSGIRHTVACLEAPEKFQFAEQVQAHGGHLLLCPTNQELAGQIRQADIVQLEWWHHPVVAGWMCADELPPMRLVVWSHVSGLHPPEIPPAFVAAPHRFLFTSPCSWEHPRLAALEPKVRQRVGVVYSSGGFHDLPIPSARHHNGSLRVGYVGTLNFAKLHPRLMDFLAAVRLPSFRLALVGDPTTGTELLTNAASTGIKDLELRGYRADVAKELAGFDVLAYLLNPLHYGTTENALLEAMAMGVVPIVLNNPAERHLVTHLETGIVVDGPAAFADALDWLAANPDERARLSANAARTARARFAVERTADGLMTHYQAVLKEEKRSYDLRPVFGCEPADWFRACQGAEAWRFSDSGASKRPTGFVPSFLYERTKSSVFHYRATYPSDVRLAYWAQRLTSAQ
ncbi:glycosyltransferase family 4 protein [Candidatus Methylomirabilis sp.]|uniref:glycosyltransferase family 4 protein n=1 Tax=Candidatus Methylomirabilis sp. TaxID=2032687 RepID=UPI002A6576A6|nr:glycosyltransferase family 4 protein [Candidatus Methylomirabilis sp.]